MKRFSRGVILVASLLLFYTASRAEYLEPIKNPYYRTPEWRLWYRDQTPIPSPALIAPGQVGQIAPPPESARLFPDDADTKAKPGSFLAFRKTDWPGRKYAGFWDDVYLSVDQNPGGPPPTPHSWMPRASAWTGILDKAVPSAEGKFMAIYCPQFMGNPVNTFGVNFTSQSTTGMGHDIANNGPAVGAIERQMYFANCLRAGPAYISYSESDFFQMQDLYQALVPCYFNSDGASSGEVHALAKMMVAGAYLPKDMKCELKRNGLYIATLLYIWKAALPFDVPYDNELRHRVAYCSDGAKLTDAYTLNRAIHLYDESAHLANMVAMAKSMTVAPPVSLLKKVDVTGGTEQYFHKTAALIFQKKDETVKIRVATSDCYDLAGRPLTFRFKVLYGNLKTTIEREGDSDTYLITVPPDARLPMGRTSILLIANNGMYDSNPACINVYRPDGKPNSRPSLEGLGDCTILPGEKVAFDIKGEDPQGFPVVLFRRSGEVGTLSQNTFTWDCPANTPDGVYPVTILASDTKTGTNSRQVAIHVTSTRAKITADKSTGPSPLSAKFSADASSDRAKNKLTYAWDFNDGAISTDAQPTHVFSQPGFYRVKLTVTGPLGAHTDQLVVTAAHSWSLRLNNGWTDKGLDPATWNTKVLPPNFASIQAGVLVLTRRANSTGNLETAATFAPPFYLETEFKKPWAAKEESFDILGCQIGWGHNGGVAPMIIRNPATNKEQEIGIYLSGGPAEKATLRLYVVPDPLHSGKIRYTGYLDSHLGSYYFSFDDQNVSPGTLKFLLDFARCELTRFQIWSPVAAPATQTTQATR